MEFGWVKDLLTFLFGSVGVLGTVIICFAAYVASQLKAEQEEHRETRKRYEEMAEGRMQLYGTLLKTISELKSSMDALTVIVSRKRSL